MNVMGGQMPGFRALKTVASFKEATLLKRENVAKFIQYLSPFHGEAEKPRYDRGLLDLRLFQVDQIAIRVLKVKPFYA